MVWLVVVEHDEVVVEVGFEQKLYIGVAVELVAEFGEFEHGKLAEPAAAEDSNIENVAVAVDVMEEVEEVVIGIDIEEVVVVAVAVGRYMCMIDFDDL